MHTSAISIAMVGSSHSYDMSRWACWIAGKWKGFWDEVLLSCLIVTVGILDAETCS